MTSAKRSSRRHSKARSTHELRRYATAAASAVVAGTSAANAAIISSGPMSLSITTAGTSNTQTIDLLPSTGKFAFKSYNPTGTGNDRTVFNTQSFSGSINYAMVSSWKISRLSLNTVIGPAADAAVGNGGNGWFTSSATYNNDVNGNNTYYGGNNIGSFNGQSGYLGIRFRTTSSGPYYYGWIAYTGNNGTFGGTVTGWAYNDVAGESILAGQTVPEPTGLAVLAAGALAGTASIAVKRWRSKQLAV
jgi:hypothetical protein